MLELLPLPPPPNPSTSTAALKLLTLLGRICSRVPASYLTGLLSTAEGSRSQRRSASGAAQSSNGRRGRPEPLPGELRLRRRKSPPDAAVVSGRHRPSRSRPGRPGQCPCRGGSGGRGSYLLTGAPALVFLLLSSSARLSSSPALSPLPSPSPPVTLPRPHPSPALGCPGHGVWSHSEKDSGFRPAAEPGVPEAEAMCAIVGAHLGCCLSVVGSRDRCRLLFGCRRLAAEVSPNGAVPLWRRLFPSHHRWDSAPRPPGWARELGSRDAERGPRGGGAGLVLVLSKVVDTFLLVRSSSLGDTIEMA